MRWLVFTDLDGTLLDHDTYSYDAAQPALQLIKEKKIPLVVCTSKTRAEIEDFRAAIGNADPFISENGGAIFVPKGYFDFGFDYSRETDNYLVVELGTGYEQLLQTLDSIRKSGINILGFNDMTDEELAADTGLSLSKARLAKKREYDEAFKLINPALEEKVKQAIVGSGLNCTKGGRYWHIMGNNDKGRAVQLLTGFYRKAYSELLTIGLGDSQNDFSMLDNVDTPYIMKRKDGSYAIDRYNKSPGIGPAGWNRTITGLLKNG